LFFFRSDPVETSMLVVISTQHYPETANYGVIVFQFYIQLGSHAFTEVVCYAASDTGYPLNYEY